MALDAQWSDRNSDPAAQCCLYWQVTAEDKVRPPVRDARREHDRPPGACVCDRFHLFGGATAGLCSRLSGNHDSESLRRADSGVSSGEVILATPELQLPLMFLPRQSRESFQPAKR